MQISFYFLSNLIIHYLLAILQLAAAPQQSSNVPTATVSKKNGPVILTTIAVTTLMNIFQNAVSSFKIQDLFICYMATDLMHISLHISFILCSPKI